MGSRQTSQLRAETGSFLSGSPATGSFTPVILDGMSGRDSGVTLSANEISEVYGTDSSLTGAAKPYLPMTITAPSKDGPAIVFTMLINPETMNVGKTNATNAAYTREGYVTQLWGPNLDVISSTGKTAAFMMPAIGTTSLLRKYSFGFLNFMALLNAYKANGYVFVTGAQANEFSRVISLISGVEISYDNSTYLGHFSNFTLDEDGEHPYFLSYNFEFINGSSSGTYNEIRGHFQSFTDAQQALVEGNQKLLLASAAGSNGTNPESQKKSPEDDLNTLIAQFAADNKSLFPQGATLETFINLVSPSGLRLTDGSVIGNRNLQSYLADPTKQQTLIDAVRKAHKRV